MQAKEFLTEELSLSLIGDGVSRFVDFATFAVHSIQLCYYFINLNRLTEQPVDFRSLVRSQFFLYSFFTNFPDRIRFFSIFIK